MVDLTTFKDRILDAAVARWFSSKFHDKMLLRGSYVTRRLVGRHNRYCHDLDFLAINCRHLNGQVAADFLSAMQQEFSDDIRFHVEKATKEIIFAESDFPGFRLMIPVSNNSRALDLQVDIGFGDPLSSPAEQLTLDYLGNSVSLLVPSAEEIFGWKLHGLVEFEGRQFHGKSLADLWLLAVNLTMSESRLKYSIRLAFQSRDSPIWRLDRLISGKMGRSSSSQKLWRKICTDFEKQSPDGQKLPCDLSEVVSLVGNYIDPIISPLRSAPNPFPNSVTFNEMMNVVSEMKGFQVVEWEDGGKILAYRNIDKSLTPNLLEAATDSEYRKRQLIREARGITFDRNGTVIARPFPMFDAIRKIQEEELIGATVLEKLDGSLVFPSPTKSLPNCRSWVWRTIRGRSEIAEDAARFVDSSSGGYKQFVEHCLSEGWTPLFEWCSRSHIIVLDHPEERLVLTGVRKNSCGTFVEYIEIRRLSVEFQIPVVKSLGIVNIGDQWEKKVENWQHAEGVILALESGRMVKVKSNHYRLLHQAVEGPEPDFACWVLFLNGHENELIELGIRRNRDFSILVNQMEQDVNLVLKAVQEKSLSFEGNRRQFALSMQSEGGLKRMIHFCLFDRNVNNLKEIFLSQLKSSCDNFSRYRELRDWISQIKGDAE